MLITIRCISVIGMLVVVAAAAAAAVVVVVVVKDSDSLALRLRQTTGPHFQNRILKIAAWRVFVVWRAVLYCRRFSIVMSAPVRMLDSWTWGRAVSTRGSACWIRGPGFSMLDSWTWGSPVSTRLPPLWPLVMLGWLAWTGLRMHGLWRAAPVFNELMLRAHV